MKLRVAVIYGGRSGEHEISLRSAKSIIEALDPDRYHILHYLISKEGRWSPKPIQPEPGANAHIDVAFPILHGTFGEDGTVQGLLELAGLPYVGAGVFASAAAMDKDAMKRLCRERGLPVVEYVVMPPGKPDPALPPQHFSYPMFVKPANLGSSVGISKASNPGELAAALELAARFDRKVIVERAIVGKELECAVLGNEEPEASLPCEILPSKEFYDYEDKYLLDKAECVIPADLSAADTEELRRIAVEAYKAVQCEGMARVDFLQEAATGKLYLNEINTIPGFTSISMFPKMWEHSGVPMPKLVDKLIELALARHEARKNLRYSL
ncbi:MAG: D-alanine--D-alanine ligase A [Bryobacteraceae bacterium]|nr:D-alanine--D-alanine ligase A [Bryobacteraceae bacterium]